MSPTSPIDVVLQFEQVINSRSAEAISSMMTADAEFIDSLGNRLKGTEKLRAAWEGYFKMVPDYSISHSGIFADGNTVAVFGSAGNICQAGPTEQGRFLEDASRVAGRRQRWQDRRLAGVCRQRTDPINHAEIFCGMSSSEKLTATNSKAQR